MEYLRTEGPLSRANLSAATGLSRSAVSSLVSCLLEEKLIHEIGLQPSEGGRPGMLLDLNPGGGCVVGVEIGVGFITVILTDFIAQVLWRRKVLFDPVAEERDVVLEKAGGLVQEALEAGRSRGLRRLGIGLGVPGLVDVGQGSLVFAPNLRWRDVPLGTPWKERFGLPVFVENEANAGALGEHYFGVAQDVENVIYLSAGVGLGAGIIIQGALFHGVSGFAGEVGHMTVDPDGEPCGCGKRGCWETVVGPHAIVRQARELVEEDAGSLIRSLVDDDLDRIDVDLVIEAAEGGDAVAREVLHEVGVQLGIGIGNLVNVFNPAMVVLGGALNLASPFLLPVIEQMVRQHALAQPREALTIAASAHGADACVMGGAALVLQDVFV